MSSWLIAIAIGALAAAIQYVRLRAPAGPRRALLATLRGIALAIAIALVLDAPLGRPQAVQPMVFVDASLSMSRDGGSLLRQALDSARAAGADSVFLFG